MIEYGFNQTVAEARPISRSPQLGQVTDREYAEYYGLSISSARKSRLDAGIPAFGRHMYSVDDWALINDRTLTDTEVAAKIGVFSACISQLRQRPTKSKIKMLAERFDCTQADLIRKAVDALLVDEGPAKRYVKILSLSPSGKVKAVYAVLEGCSNLDAGTWELMPVGWTPENVS